MRLKPDLLKQLFLHSVERVTSSYILHLYRDVRYSFFGTSLREREDRIMSNWRQYLQDMDSYVFKAFINVIIFSTNLWWKAKPYWCVAIFDWKQLYPTLGYWPYPIYLLYCVYPEVSTCAPSLQLSYHSPQDYEEFKHFMNFAVLNAPDFGQV